MSRTLAIPFFLFFGLMTDTDAQVRRVEVTTRSTQVNSSFWTEHGRPMSLRPFLVPGSLGGSGRLTTSIDYAVDVTNNEASPVTTSLAVDRSAPYFTDGNCWGAGSGVGIHLTGITTSVPPGATQSETRSVDLSPLFVSMNSANCSFGDGIHTPSGSSVLYAGPAQLLNWRYSNFGADLTVTDAGTIFTNEMEFTTRYDLPIEAGSSGCEPLQPNSTGNAGKLEALGVADVATGPLFLHGTDLPANQFAFVIMASSTQPATPIGFGQATLCLAAPLYRWNTTLGLTDPAGQFLLEVPTAAAPVPSGAITAGSSWAFQLLHRDVVAGQNSANSTNAVVVDF